MTIKGFSGSMRRATIMFTEPGRGRSIVQENDETPDPKLRTAIAAARQVFWEIYNAPDPENTDSQPASDLNA